MMENKEFVVAILPPALAIAIELLNPFNGRYFEKAANEIIRDDLPQPDASQAELQQLIAMVKIVLGPAMTGAASIAGLAPTLVAFIMTCVAVVYFIDDTFYWFVGLIVIGVLLALSMAVVASTRSPLQMETRPLRAFGRPLLLPTSLFSWLIYVTNAIVILGFVAVKFDWLG